MTTSHSPQFLVTTTTGAYVCISNTLKGEQKAALEWLFSRTDSPKLAQQTLEEMRAEAGIQAPKKALQELLKKKLITLENHPHHCPKAPMQDALPQILSELSDAGRAMITDSNGLCIASIGIDPERHEALSALASKITASLYHANHDVFELLDMKYGLTCLYDVGSKHVFTFIPLSFGTNKLVVVTQGQAVFSGQNFRDLIWVLWKRYALPQTAAEAHSNQEHS